MVKKLFLTPPTMPDDVKCRTLKIPNSKDWLGIFNSALLLMTQYWNYEQVNDTDLTVQETIDRVNLMLQEYWDTIGCGDCALPDGSPVLRVNPSTGHIEQLIDGDWVTPTGEYAIPAAPPRPPAPPDDVLCLAAANATNALKTLYENLTDSWANGLSTAEAITAFLGGLGIALTAEFAPPVAALIGIGELIFQVLYEVVGFVGADVWDDDFTSVMNCYLRQCASADGDNVVTFDFQCVIDKIAAQTDIFDLSAASIRLFGQLYYILSFIGADGLNYAGSGTGITEADCDCGWCQQWNFLTSNGGYSASSYASTWVSGTGWTRGNFGATSGTGIELSFAEALITHAEFTFTGIRGTNPGNMTIFLYKAGIQVARVDSAWANGTVTWQYNNAGGIRADKVVFAVQTSGAGVHNGTANITHAELQGALTSPFGENNC